MNSCINCLAVALKTNLLFQGGSDVFNGHDRDLRDRDLHDRV
jgi:hypothetical protein